MKKSPSEPVHIPDDLWDKIATVAKARGVSSSDVVVQILAHALRDDPLERWTKNGVLDEKKFKADCRRISADMKKWDKEHADEVARIVRFGAPVRRSVHHD